MVKFPQIGLLLQLFADAFLVTQSADRKTEGRVGSKFREELSELAKGNTLKNFKNINSYLLTQLSELDNTGVLSIMCNALINFYRDLIRKKYIGKLSAKELHDYLLVDACAIIAISINECGHDYYAPTNQLVKKVHVLWFLPDLQKSKSGLGVLFDWLEKEHSLSRYQLAKHYDEIKGLNPDNRGSALRYYWEKLSNIGEFGKGNLQTLEKLEQAIWLSIEDKYLMDKKRLRLNLLLARGFDYLFSELQENFTQEELDKSISFMKELVTHHINKDVLPRMADEWKRRGFSLDTTNELPKLYKPTDVETKKQESDEKTAKELFEFFKNNPPIENLTGILDWYRGRFYVLSGKLEEGLKSYKQAFTNLQFVWGGEPIEKVIVESLALTAFLGKDRRFFEEVYYYGALIGLFAPLEEREVDYQYHQWSLAFNQYFSPNAYYHSVSTEKKQKIIEQGSQIKVATFDEINKAADKQSKTNVFNTRPKSQLQSAINAPNKTAEDVIKLINNGVDVNFMDNSGGTALIEALQKYYGLLGTDKNEKASRIINQLLVEDLSKSINSASKGKGISALSLAIDAFDIDMINRLITSGADVKGNCHKPEMSYVYYTLNRYAWSKQTSVQYASEDKTVAIIKLLLENGALPNGHFINDLTPLMLATELDLTKVVELLLEYKADINALNNCGKKVIDYAIGFSRPEIKALLVSCPQ